MRHLLLGFALLLSGTFAGTAWSHDGLNGSAQSGEIVGSVIEGRQDFMEGWNVDQPFDGSWHYGAACQGPTYVAGRTYILERIEFMAGEIAGTAVIEVCADDGSGCPTGAVLGSGSFQQEVTLGWQGADIAPPVPISQGQTYHINYRVVIDSPSSFALGGDLIPHCWSWDCSFWEGPAASFYWMAKFFGSEVPSAVEQSTWARIKALYQ